jgi:glutathione S-transferase
VKLYSDDHSPYAARVRLALYAYDLPVEVVGPPPGGTKSADWLALNPLGTIPALITDDGEAIPESDTILEFLADAYPDAGLRPDTPVARARARLIARVVDLYAMPAGTPLVAQMFAQPRSTGAVEEGFAALDRELTRLNLFMTEDAYAVGKRLSTADCALVPMLFYVGVFAQTFGRSDLLAGHGKLAAYWERVKWDPAVKRLLTEMGQAAARLGG